MDSTAPTFASTIRARTTAPVKSIGAANEDTNVVVKATLQVIFRLECAMESIIKVKQN